MSKVVQVGWNECRDGELYFVVGELAGRKWRFFERSSWELRWYAIHADARHVARAAGLVEQRRAA